MYKIIEEDNKIFIVDKNGLTMCQCFRHPTANEIINALNAYYN